MIFWAVPIGWIFGYCAGLAYSANNKGWAYILFAIAMFLWQVIVIIKCDGGKKDE